MSWLYGDSFDSYATADLGDRYPNLTIGRGIISVGTGRDGTNAYRGSNDGHIGRGIPTSSGPIFVHVALRNYAPSGSPTPCIAFWDSVTAVRQQVSVLVNADGSLSVNRGLTNEAPLQWYGTILGTTAPNLVLPNAYTHLGAMATIDPVAGAVKLWVNGQLVLDLSGINTRNDSTASSALNEIYIGNPFDFDDFIITDGVDTGDGCVGFLGDLIGERSLLTGAGAAADWTPSAGLNHQCVDDPTPDGDATTVSAAAVAATDLYTHASLVRIGSGIRCHQVVTHAKKSTGGTRALTGLVRVGGTPYADGDHYLGTTYAAQVSPFALNPATGLPWTVAEVNASQAGQKVTV